MSSGTIVVHGEGHRGNVICHNQPLTIGLTPTAALCAFGGLLNKGHRWLGESSATGRKLQPAEMTQQEVLGVDPGARIPSASQRQPKAY
ncbi:hypothetical protein GW7_08719 [Heterocephalus glaber]|uniref:Uncharacterized protein n=1 Tax=Heterocephalus glaber TaxID=10181 RepID=G5B429_HETGA|nr:hypothetical protein GW7_08719 [Heterocephalus glaber]